MKLSENMIQFIWKFRLFRQSGLFTLSDKKIRIENVGTQNLNEGPDFLNAIVRVDGIRLVGNVEIERRASDWKRHRHHQNAKYNNVILHVVYEYDSEVRREDGSILETLVLEPLIEEQTLRNYQAIAESKNWIPCEALISTVEPLYIQGWLERLTFDRLEQKSAFVSTLLEEFEGDWERVAYVLFARSFGFSVNVHAFDLLARSVPLDLLRSYQGQPIQQEALLFGQAGMLGAIFNEKYPSDLQELYKTLRLKHRLKPITKESWSFLRMRPANFPTLRIAQFAAFCQTFNQFFPLVFESENLNLWKSWLNRLSVNEYWTTHYRFGRLSVRHSAVVGKTAAQAIFINTLCLLLFSFGKFSDKPDLMNFSVKRLSEAEAERNALVRRYQTLGVEVRSAIESQALKQLKTIYCDRKRCLYCEVGLQIIKKNKK